MTHDPHTDEHHPWDGYGYQHIIKDGNSPRYGDHFWNGDHFWYGEREHPRDGVIHKINLAALYDDAQPHTMFALSRNLYKLTGTNRQADKPTYCEACT